MACIYKILRPAEWAQFERDEIFRGAPVDLNDGYIHFSSKEQVTETAAKYFSECASVVLLRFDEDGFGTNLKWEPSRGGALFPHLYDRVLGLDDIDARWTLRRGPDGLIFPPDY